MSKSNRSLKVLAAIIKRLEEDAGFANVLEGLLSGNDNASNSRREQQVEFDIFEEFTAVGRQSLSLKLDKLDEEQLKLIIRDNGLDSRKLAQKWKSKDKLVNLILDRVEEKTSKGNTFLNFKEGV